MDIFTVVGMLGFWVLCMFNRGCKKEIFSPMPYQGLDRYAILLGCWSRCHGHPDPENYYQAPLSAKHHQGMPMKGRATTVFFWPFVHKGVLKHLQAGSMALNEQAMF